MRDPKTPHSASLEEGKARNFPAVRSILSPQALLSQIVSDYDVGAPVECNLWKPSINDTYVVKTAQSTYILRVSPAQGRTQAEILYELDLLNYLDRKGIPVPVPVERSDGTFLFSLDALEGVRYGVLFTCAEGGDAPFPIDAPHSLLYGRALAEVHTSLDNFSSQHERPPLDFDLLLDRPLQALLPLLENRPDDAAYLLLACSDLENQIDGPPNH